MYIEKSVTRNQEGPGKPSEAKEGKDWMAAMPDSSQGILRVTSLAFPLFFSFSSYNSMENSAILAER